MGDVIVPVPITDTTKAAALSFLADELIEWADCYRHFLKSGNYYGRFSETTVLERLAMEFLAVTDPSVEMASDGDEFTLFHPAQEKG